MSNLLKSGNFTLHSGEKSDWIIDCDALTEDDLAVVARMILRKYSRFSSVGCPPSHEGSAAIRLKDMLAPLASDIRPKYRLLIVDDVFTTGSSMNDIRAGEKLFREPKLEIVGAVIFARRPTPDWIYSVFQVNE